MGRFINYHNVCIWFDTWEERRVNHLPLQCRIMRQTLSNLTFLPHQIKTAVPNWFRRRSLPYLIPQLGSALEWSGVWTGPKEAAYFRVCCKSCTVSCPTISTASAEFPFERRATFYRKKSVRPFYENVAKNLKRIWQIFLFKSGRKYEI